MNSRNLTIVVLVVLAAFLLLPMLAMAAMWGGFGMMGPGMMGHGAWGGGWFGGFGPLIVLLLIAGIVLAVLGYTRREPRPEEPRGPQAPPGQGRDYKGAVRGAQASSPIAAAP